MTVSKARFDLAVGAVKKACRVCEGLQRRISQEGVLSKDDKSPVTVADFASQAVVCAVLNEVFPDEVIVAEEGAECLKNPDNSEICSQVVDIVAREMGHVSQEEVVSWIDRGSGDADVESFWTLDPIDGTKGFLRGDQYAVALAFLEKGEPVLGVLGCPNLEVNQRRGVIFAADMDSAVCRLYSTLSSNIQAGKAWTDNSAEGVPLNPPPLVDVRRARFCESVEKAHSDHSVSAKIAAEAGLSSQPCRIDSQCKYGVVATGEASLYLRIPRGDGYREKIWDHGAGVVVVQCAGGQVTDLDGEPLDFSRGHRLIENRGVVVTSGGIHECVLDAVKRLGV